MGAKVYFHSLELDLAALHVRRVGPQYLRAFPLEEIRSRLRDFFTDNFDHISRVAFISTDVRPLSAIVTQREKNELAGALAASRIFNPKDELTVFPLVPVIVKDRFSSDQFFFTSPEDDDAFQLGDERLRREIDPRLFPPQASFSGRRRSPSAWLGVYSPDYRAALKVRSSVLGALALTSPSRCRHAFSGRQIFGGRCTISSSDITYSFEHEHTPPCMHDICITGQDRAWMEELSGKLRSVTREIARELKSLEYFFRAWSLPPEERFPVLSMALDAVFGDANNATQSVVDGVRATLGNGVPERRLRAILSLRASVIHGGAPDVYDSRKYPKYYREYGCDPIRDLELVVSACLRAKVFGGKLFEHPDPEEALIAKAQAEGVLPPRIRSASILEPRP